MRELQRGRLGVALTQPKVGWEPDMVMRFIVGFLVDESGATSIEYGLVLKLSLCYAIRLELVTSNPRLPPRPPSASGTRRSSRHPG